MSEELKAIDFLRAKTISYESDAKELHYSLILYNLIINLQQENQQLKEQLKQKEDIINKAREYIYEHARIDDEYPAYIEMLLEEKKELLEILDNKGE